MKYFTHDTLNTPSSTFVKKLGYLAEASRLHLLEHIAKAMRRI